MRTLICPPTESEPEVILYRAQITMSDDTYMRLAPTLALKLCVPHVRGVYEARQPLAAEAALQLGCVVSVAQHAQHRPLGEGFSLTDLQVCT